MAERITNMEKYENYREQMGRLKKAVSSGFFLEAIFIEYAVMEDRLTSILIHAGHWTSPPDKHISINKKLHLVDQLRENKNNVLIQKYFPSELIRYIKILDREGEGDVPPCYILFNQYYGSDSFFTQNDDMQILGSFPRYRTNNQTRISSYDIISQVMAKKEVFDKIK